MFAHTQLLSKPFITLHFPSHPPPPRLLPLHCTSNDDKPTATPPPPPVEIRFRRGRASRRRRQQQEEADEARNPTKLQKEAAPKKEWDEMSYGEKALELYLGEKGALFWLNKFAYASIYVIIGAWIVFRFVGPALNLYQLDSAPLAPEKMFKEN